MATTTRPTPYSPPNPPEIGPDPVPWLTRSWLRDGAFSDETVELLAGRSGLGETDRRRLGAALDSALGALRSTTAALQDSDRPYSVRLGDPADTASTTYATRSIVIGSGPLTDPTLNPAQRAVIMAGLTFHEVGHVRLTRHVHPALERAYKGRSADLPVARRVANVYEDVRTEAIDRREFPGMAGTLDATMRWVTDRTIREAKPGTFPKRLDLTHREGRLEMIGAALRYPTLANFDTTEAERAWLCDLASKVIVARNTKVIVALISEATDWVLSVPAKSELPGEEPEPGEDGEDEPTEPPTTTCPPTHSPDEGDEPDEDGDESDEDGEDEGEGPGGSQPTEDESEDESEGGDGDGEDGEDESETDPTGNGQGEGEGEGPEGDESEDGSGEGGERHGGLPGDESDDAGGAIPAGCTGDEARDRGTDTAAQSLADFAHNVAHKVGRARTYTDPDGGTVIVREREITRPAYEKARAADPDRWLDPMSAKGEVIAAGATEIRGKRAGITISSGYGRRHEVGTEDRPDAGAAIAAAISSARKGRQAPERGCRSGKLDRGKLARVGAGDNRVFIRRDAPSPQRVRVHVLIDASGSMADTVGSRPKVQVAAQVARDLAAALDIIGWADGRIYAHTTDYNGPFIVPLWRKGEARGQIDDVFSIEMRGNWDGYAIAYAADDLIAEKRADERGLLIVLSDGYPAGPPNYVKGNAHTKSTVDFYRNRGLRVVSISIDPSMRGEGQKALYGQDVVDYDPQPAALAANLARVIGSSI